MPVNAPSDPTPHFALEDTASAIASARRAALANRFAADSLSIEWREMADLAAIAGEWRDLAARSLAPNVFYEPAFALAAAPVFGQGAGAVLVWSGTQPRKLLGFFPARIERRRYWINLPVLTGWTHPYAPLCAPLVERDAAEPVIAAWLAHVAADKTLPGLLLLPYLPGDGPFAAALETILRRAQMPAAEFNRHRRAMLAPAGADRAHYLERALSAHRLKELRRTARRLSDRGALMFTTATEPSAVDDALDDFFSLEASGWKGRAGTAAVHHAKIGGFMRTALCALAAEDKVAVNRILLDGRAVAAAITLRSADQAWFWKIAYDEAFARYSPGVMLTVALTEELLDNLDVERADSCATANHPMIDHIWRERLVLGDLLIGVRPQAPFMRAWRLEKLRGSAIMAAKRLRNLFRR